MEVTLTVPMIYDMELAVSKTAESLANFLSFTHDQIDEIKQALIEACINAIEHSRSPDRHIYIQFRLYEDKLRIIVRDRGLGFDPDKVENPNLNRKLFKNSRKRGWGLMLMKHYMDEIDIRADKDGAVITMTKRLS